MAFQGSKPSSHRHRSQLDLVLPSASLCGRTFLSEGDVSHEIEIFLSLHETFSITAKASRISFGLCGCVGKSKQDDAVSQSSGVCMTKGCKIHFIVM